MDQVKDLRPFAAIALGIVALFAVFNMGRNMGSSYGYGPGYQGVPQQIIVQPAPVAPGGQVITLPPGVAHYPMEHERGHRFGGGPGMIIFPLLFGLGLFFLATRFFGGRGRGGWQGGPRNWGGPEGPQAPQGPQGPYPANQQPYPAPQQQASQAQGQPYQQQNPAYMPQQPPQPYAEGEQGQQTRAIDPRGDITRPEGENY